MSDEGLRCWKSSKLNYFALSNRKRKFSGEAGCIWSPWSRMTADKFSFQFSTMIKDYTAYRYGSKWSSKITALTPGQVNYGLRNCLAESTSWALQVALHCGNTATHPCSALVWNPQKCCYDWEWTRYSCSAPLTTPLCKVPASFLMFWVPKRKSAFVTISGDHAHD